MVISATTALLVFVVITTCLSPVLAESKDVERIDRSLTTLRTPLGQSKEVEDWSAACQAEACGLVLGMAILDPLIYIAEPFLFVGSGLIKFIVSAFEFAKCMDVHFLNILYCGQELAENVEHDFAFLRNFFSVYNSHMEHFNQQIAFAVKECIHKTQTCKKIKPDFPPVY